MTGRIIVLYSDAHQFSARELVKILEKDWPFLTVEMQPDSFDLGLVHPDHRCTACEVDRHGVE